MSLSVRAYPSCAFYLINSSSEGSILVYLYLIITSSRLAQNSLFFTTVERFTFKICCRKIIHSTKGQFSLSSLYSYHYAFPINPSFFHWVLCHTYSCACSFRCIIYTPSKCIHKMSAFCDFMAARSWHLIISF